MLIVPVPRKLSIATFPFVTLLLLAVNVYVFFALQLPDGRVVRAYAEAYVKSGLARQEIPAYTQWLSAEGKPTPAPTAQALADGEYQAQGGLAIARDRKFQQALPALMQKTLNADAYAAWQRGRADVDLIWQHNFTERYLFVPAIARAETLITHMFMHGGLGHLLGNMAMLMLIGLLVEPAVGGWRTATIYLAGGLGAVAPYLVFSDSWTGTLGASGAISALMGACAVLYGLRRVRFFYHLVFYFNFIVLPAIVVLPLWIANELWQWLHYGNVSNVAYLVHAGGLVAGAALALAFRGKAALEIENAKTPTLEQEAEITKLRGRAYAALKKMQVDTAARDFEQLLQYEPENLEYARQLYTCSRGAPASERYHRAALQLLRLAAQPVETALLAKTITEYGKSASPAPRWTSGDMVRYAKLLAKTEQRELAAALVDALLKLPAAQLVNADLPDAVLTLALACRRAGQGQALEKSRHYLNVLETRFPGSEQSRIARQFAKTD